MSLKKQFLRKDGITGKEPNKRELKSLLKWAENEVIEWKSFIKDIKLKLKKY